MKISASCLRIELVTDSYTHTNSLKQENREMRGSGTLIAVNDHAKFPKNFRTDFLRNTENKQG